MSAGAEAVMAKNMAAVVRKNMDAREEVNMALVEEMSMEAVEEDMAVKKDRMAAEIRMEEAAEVDMAINPIMAVPKAPTRKVNDSAQATATRAEHRTAAEVPMEVHRMTFLEPNRKLVSMLEILAIATCSAMFLECSRASIRRSRMKTWTRKMP